MIDTCLKQIPGLFALQFFVFEGKQSEALSLNWSAGGRSNYVTAGGEGHEDFKVHRGIHESTEALIERAIEMFRERLRAEKLLAGG